MKLLTACASAVLVAGALTGAALAPQGGLAPQAGYDGDDPAVLQLIADRTAEGAELISTSTATYEPVADDSATSALPSGCELVVLITKSDRLISGDSITSCQTPFGRGYMGSALAHYNPDWNIWDVTLDNDSTNLSVGTIMTTHMAYNCSNGNASNYRNETSGSLSIAGTSYIATAYDIFDEDVDCGT